MSVALQTLSTGCCTALLLGQKATVSFRMSQCEFLCFLSLHIHKHTNTHTHTHTQTRINLKVTLKEFLISVIDQDVDSIDKSSVRASVNSWFGFVHNVGTK